MSKNSILSRDVGQMIHPAHNHSKKWRQFGAINSELQTQQRAEPPYLHTCSLKDQATGKKGLILWQVWHLQLRKCPLRQLPLFLLPLSTPFKQSGKSWLALGFVWGYTKDAHTNILFYCIKAWGYEHGWAQNLPCWLYGDIDALLFCCICV